MGRDPLDRKRLRTCERHLISKHIFKKRYSATGNQSEGWNSTELGVEFFTVWQLMSLIRFLVLEVFRHIQMHLTPRFLFSS